MNHTYPLPRPSVISIRRILLALCLAWVGAPATLPAATVTVIEENTFQLSVKNITNPDPKQQQTVTLRLWTPPDIKTLRGVIFCGPGAGGGDKGLGYAQNPRWRILAQRHGFGLAGIRWDSYAGQNPTNNQGTSVEDLEYALKTIGNEVSHPELAVAPVAIWGMSASGGFAVGYANARPERCLTFCDNKGGSVGGYNLEGDALFIPGLLCYNENDLTGNPKANSSHEGTPDVVAQSYVDFRSQGALVTIVPDWGIGHEYWGYGQYLALAYFDQVIESRIPDNYQPGTAAKLIPLTEKSGWLGTCNNFGYTDPFTSEIVGSYSTAANPTVPAIVKRTDFKGTDQDALNGIIYTWLPNEYIARLWQAASVYTHAAKISSPDESNSDPFSTNYSFVPGTSVSISAIAQNGFTPTSMTWYDGLTQFDQSASGQLTTSIRPSFGLHPIRATVSTRSGVASTTGFSLIGGTRGTPMAPTFTTAATITPDVLKPSDTATLNALAKPTDGSLDRLITYTWSVVSGPDIATFSSSNGSHQGNSLTVSFPTSGTYILQVVASNAEGKNSTAQITANVTDTGKLSPNIITQPSTTAKLGTTYSYGFHATGKPAPTYTLVTAPTGMTIDSASGLISWAPDSVGTFAVTAQASNGEAPDATQSFSITVSGVVPTITSSPITQSVVNGSYRYRVIATGLPAPTYQLTQAPTGMSIDSSGLISWTPDGMGEFFVAVAVTNDAGSVSQSFNVNVQAPPTITSTPVTTATAGVPYTSQTYATGYPTPTYSLITYPADMKIDSATGAISWTPTSNGFYTVTLQASNGTTPATQTFVIAVNGGTSTTDNGVTTTSTTSSASSSGGGGGGCGLGSGAAAALLGLSILLMKRLRSRQA